MRVDEESVKDQVRKFTRKIAGVPTRWRGQTHGGIIKDPGPVVICPICTVKFDTGRPYGVERKYAKRHMANHKAERE